jgi:ectoine hydroxylase-related dioxygenase (phytanoyl-CoA dioxygenase family)
MHDFKKEFASEGVIYAPKLVDNDLLTRFLQEIETSLSDPDFQNPQNMRCRYAINRELGTQMLDAIDPVTDISPFASKIALSDSILAVLNELYNDRPNLFKDKFIFRSPGAPGYPPHQDFIAWPFFPRSFVTALVALDPISNSNGCLTFYKGSHQKGLLTKADGDFHTISRSELAGCEKISFEMNPGDVVIFNALIVHESDGNMSSSSRRSLYLSYNAHSDGGDQRQAHYRYFHSWLKRRFGEYGDNRLFFK